VLHRRRFGSAAEVSETGSPSTQCGAPDSGRWAGQARRGGVPGQRARRLCIWIR
jgi:hypothetical protein